MIVIAVVVTAVNCGRHHTVSHHGTLSSSPHSVVGIAIVGVQSCGPTIRPSVIRDVENMHWKKESQITVRICQVTT